MKKIFINGKIKTMDEKCSAAEAMLCVDGKIAAIGTNEEIMNLDKECDVTDLEGKDVLPGFIDSHIHLLDHAIFENKTALLGEAKSPEEMVEITKPGGEFPTIHDLDKISDKHPIMLTRRSGTICAANSMAMKIAGIDGNTPDPQGGELVRFADGTPTGVMLESAMSLIGDCVPKISDKLQIKELLEFSFSEMVKNGITVCHTEDFYSVGDKRALWEAYLELNAEGKMPIDLVLQLRIHRPDQLQEFFDFGFHSWQRFGKVKIGPIKFLGDGSLGAWSAALNEPYSDKPDTCGCLYWNKEELTKIAKEIVDHDFDLTIHAIGDAAVENFLDGCIAVKDEIKAKGLRPSIIHSQIMNERILEKYHVVDAIGLVQPMYIHSDWRIADARVGDRMKTSYCFGSMLRDGIRLAGSSDLPIESCNPFEAIQVNVTRKDLEGNPEGGWYPDEKLSRVDAVRMYTTFGAYASKEENSLGSLEVGKRANFIVASGDVFSVLEDEIKNLEVVNTYIDGEMVYEKSKI